MTAPVATAAGPTAQAAAAPALSIGGLKTRAGFLRAAKGRRQAMPGFILQARRRGADEPHVPAIRVGFTCSRKVGNAVRRNRAKRRLREVARLVLPGEGRAGWDYVLIGRAGVTATREFGQMQTDLRAALARVHGA